MINVNEIVSGERLWLKSFFLDNKLSRLSIDEVMRLEPEIQSLVLASGKLTTRDALPKIITRFFIKLRILYLKIQDAPLQDIQNVKDILSILKGRSRSAIFFLETGYKDEKSALIEINVLYNILLDINKSILR